MIAFTILGVLFFWMFCWQVGYHFGEWLDVRRGIKSLFEPIEREVETLAVLLAAFTTTGASNVE